MHLKRKNLLFPIKTHATSFLITDKTMTVPIVKIM